MRDVVTVMNVIKNNRVRTILDIGIGFGTLAFNIRNLLEVHKFQKEKWKYIVDGVDINQDYITPIHRYLYDDIILGDIRDVKLKKYDVILLLEVVEHLPKEDSIRLIKRLKKQCMILIISTPYGFMRQGAKNDNPHEVHISGWTPDDFTNIGEFMVSIAINEIYAMYKSKDMRCI